MICSASEGFGSATVVDHSKRDKRRQRVSEALEQPSGLEQTYAYACMTAPPRRVRETTTILLQN